LKKLVILLTLIGFSFVGYTQAHAAADYNKRPVEVIVNGNFIKMDVHPSMDRNRLFIPIRSLASLGIHYSWNPSSKVATLKNGDGQYLKITVGSKVAYKGTQKIQMDQAAKSQDGRVLIPIRFVSETLGYHVDYETLRKMVFVNSDSYTFDMKQIAQEDLQAARKAAIALPITFNYKPLDFSGGYHNYSFPVGKADIYVLQDGRNETLVHIKDGKAIAIGQFADSDRSKTSGAILPNFILDTDPLFKPYDKGNVLFMEGRYGGPAKAVYNDENGKGVELNTKVNVYSDIIQKLPK